MARSTEPGTPTAAQSRAPRRRHLVGLVALLVVIGVLLGLLIRSPAAAKAPPAGAHGAQFAGLATKKPWQSAPALSLRNYLGVPVDLASYRGKAVLVTFIYTHCVDVCPLMVAMFHTALGEMPAAERDNLQIIAVSVDPRGDTPKSVGRFLTAHRMTGRMQYLIGSAATLRAVWAHWGIDSRPASTPDLVEHSALVYGITGKGKIAVVYPSNFGAREIVHDAGILAHD